MIHLTPQQLSSYMDGELNEASTELVRRHMGACEECTLKFAQLEIQEDLLSKALVHDPGDEFFEQFTEAVGKQVLASKGSSKPSPARPSSRNAPTTPLPSRLAMTRPAPEPSAKANEPAIAPARSAEPIPAASSASAPEDTGMGRGDGATNDWTTGADEELVGEAETPTRDMETSRTGQRAYASEPVHAAESMAVADPMDAADSPSAFDRSNDAGSDSRAIDPPSRHVDRPARGERPAPRPKTPPQPRPIRPRVHKPAPSIPWYAAIILAAISASAGVMVSRTEPVSAWLDSMAPRGKSASGYQTPSDEPPSQAPSQAPTQEIIPAPSKPAPSTTKTSTPAPKAGDASAKGTDASAKAADDSPAVDDEAMDPEITSSDDEASNGPDLPDIQPQEASRILAADTQSRAGGGKDPYASVSPSALAVVRAAQKSVTAADNDPSATRYESAAADWDRAIPLLHGWQQSLGRFELASARYRAWEMTPTPARASAATAAIRTYMASAAQGPARDQARAWMARLAR